MRTRVLCLGNELVRDDGAGIRVGRILLDLPLPAEVRVELAPHLGFDLLDAVAGAEHIVLVDAMSTGRPPGTCVTLAGRAIERHATGASLSHTLGIAELMALAHKLAPDRPPASLTFVGVEGAMFSDYGTELSPEVEAAIPEAVDAVLRIVGASEEVRAAARQIRSAASSARSAVADVPSPPSRTTAIRTTAPPAATKSRRRGDS